MQKLRVFVASPGDVLSEREMLVKVVAELNETLSILVPESGISLELLRWETHAWPSAGAPQSVINDQIGEFDIFIGIMWTRFGTPTQAGGSGTEEEFNRAYQSWSTVGRPQIMFYFCQAPAPPPGSPEDAEQLWKLAKFRQKLSEKALLWEYGAHAEFADAVRPHLLRAVRRSSPATNRERDTSSPVTVGDPEIVRVALARLAREYTELRVHMGSGSERTRLMEAIVTRMRTWALSGWPLLQSLSTSAETGDRLAAIAILEVIPQPTHIEWLGARQETEKQPFVAYHAAVALLASVRALQCVHQARLGAAIRQGLAHLTKENMTTTDRYRTLTSALDELTAKCPT